MSVRNGKHQQSDLKKNTSETRFGGGYRQGFQSATFFGPFRCDRDTTKTTHKEYGFFLIMPMKV